MGINKMTNNVYIIVQYVGIEDVRENVLSVFSSKETAENELMRIAIEFDEYCKRVIYSDEMYKIYTKSELDEWYERECSTIKMFKDRISISLSKGYYTLEIIEMKINNDITNTTIKQMGLI
jgi:hypothetical protein